MLTLDLQQHFGNLDAEPPMVSSLMPPCPQTPRANPIYPEETGT